MRVFKCKHKDFPKNRIHGLTAYVFECPRCSEKFMYCKIMRKKYAISEKRYKSYTKFVREVLEQWNMQNSM